ncbi:hypothetical protein ACLHDG_11565 [Sulfurovum sp. CS9]|uniref:hypothetical protein n=1 Tax=Sulfurovum sp. CS9 TaxID=3391146 RepID=UPI0039E824F2
MKRIILFITLSLVALYAKPCMTDIYTLNGVNTSDTSINGKPSDARKNMKALKEFMLHWGDPATLLDPQKNGQDYQFKYVYNPSYGLRDDMLETYYQLKESGQISEGYFTFILNLLTVDLGLNGLVEKYKEIISRYEGDAQGIYNAYNNSSFSQKHNLLLVAHSQGNLMGNKIYTMLTTEQKKKFRMISVGTPANHVMKPNQTAPYVTTRNDFVINRVQGALSGNVDGIGHNFINVYLGSSFEARTKIALHVKNAYDNLMQTTSCLVYEAVYMKIYDVDTLEVYAFTTNTFPRYHDLLDTIALETYDATRDSNNELTCGSPTYRLSPNTAFSSCTYGTGTSCSWKPGALYKDVLEQRKGTTHHVLHNGKCTTLSLSGELYDLVENALK